MTRRQAAGWALLALGVGIAATRNTPTIDGRVLLVFALAVAGLVLIEIGAKR